MILIGVALVVAGITGGVALSIWEVSETRRKINELEKRINELEKKLNAKP